MGGLAVMRTPAASTSVPRPARDAQPAPPAEMKSAGLVELVASILIGRAPGGDAQWRGTGIPSRSPTPNSMPGTCFLGRSYNLADTVELTFLTEKLRALQQTAKTVGRIILKEAIAEAVEHETHSEGWGELVRFILIGLLEQPDVRRWETPRWMQVARVRAPKDLAAVKVVFKNSMGTPCGQWNCRHPGRAAATPS